MWSKSIAATVASLAVLRSVNGAPSPLLVERDSSLDQLGISSGCQNTLTSLISSPAATCLNLPGTVAVFSTVANSSWIPPINAWLSTFCAAPDCTDDELTTTLNTAMDGCSTEVSQFGVDRDTILQGVVQYYPLAKQAICLRDSSNNNDLCAITALESLQTALGGDPLTPEVIITKYPLLVENDYALAKQLACTPCSSAAFAILRPALPEDILSTVDSFVGEQCGVDFTSTPTGSISVVTGTAAQLAASATASTSESTRIQVGGVMMGLAGLIPIVTSFF